MRRQISVRFLLGLFAIVFLVVGPPSLADRGGPAVSTPESTNSRPSRAAGRRRVLMERFGGMKLGMATIDTPKDSKEKGVVVLLVIPYSAAQNAGLSKGDIIVEFDGVQVTSVEQLTQIMAGLTDDTDHTITFVREGSRMKATIRVAANNTISAQAAGVKRTFTDINTLKYALIDPNTHTVTFVGSYDPAYATGTIPYADILRDVLPNPYPSLSLEPSANQRADFAKVDQMISADVSRMASDPNYVNQWGQNLMNLVLHDASLTIDNKRFFKKFASECGMTGEELKNLYDAAEGKTQMSASDSMALFAKLMRGVGLPDVANAMQAMAAGGTPDNAIRGMNLAMGLGSQHDELQKQLASGSITYEMCKNEGEILGLSAICRKFGAPEAELQSKIALVRSSGDARVMTAYYGEQMGSFIINKSGARIVNGLSLSPQLMSKMYNLPIPLSDVVCTNIPADSTLGDVLFRSDYLLKTLCTNPDVRDKIASHLTDQEFLQQEAAAQNYSLPSGSGVGLGNRLVPAEVKLRVSPKGDVVEFQNSQVKVVSWVREASGKGYDFINSTAPKYGDFLTKNYGEYAKAYPEWHKMSEVAKCVALARWAKSNNYTINAVNASNEKIAVPRQIPGFWTAVFHTDGQTASLTVVEQGGASFSPDEGEAWIKPQQDVTVTSDVSKQLIASTVLAEQSVNALKSGDLDAARDLADKSARAMSGDIDLTKLPSLDGIPVPGDPAAYAAATHEVIDQATECLNKMDTAQKDLARAGKLAATSPDEAANITQHATQSQDEAQAKLKQLLGSVSTYKNDPSLANDAVVVLHSNSSSVVTAGWSAPIGGQSTPQCPSVTTPQNPKPKDWSTQCSDWIVELDKVNKQIASTRTVLLRLNADVQADVKQFNDWEKEGDEAFDRCVGMAADVAIDWGAGALSDRYDEIYQLAQKLPDKPDDVIEKYRLMASLAKRLKEAKAANDLDGLAKREGKTDAEIYEELRDGINQVIGLLQLDKFLPGKIWKYGCYGFDMAYNLTELRIGWKNTEVLKANNASHAEAVKKLADMMRQYEDKAKILRQKIEAGEDSSGI